MTAMAAKKLMKETGCKDIVAKVLQDLNGESYSYAKNVLDILTFYIKEGSFVDAEIAKSQLEDEVEQ